MTRPGGAVQWTGLTQRGPSQSMGSDQRSCREYANNTLAEYRVLVMEAGGPETEDRVDYSSQVTMNKDFSSE